MDIAQDQVSYSEYPTMGEINDERELIEELEHDPQARSQYPVLNQFYLDRQGGILAKLNEIDRLFKTATDTPITYTTLSANLAQARVLNTALSSTEYFAQNEKWINEMYFKAILDGEAYTVQEMEDIDALASQCPYIGGMAVYKARSLNTMQYPTKNYNDIGLCNAVGVYKNGKGLFDDEEAYLDSLLNTNSRNISKIKLYPNPVGTELNIAFSTPTESNGLFELFDMAGRAVFSKPIPKGMVNIKMALPDLANGLYTYRINYNSGELYYGKLIKE